MTRNPDPRIVAQVLPAWICGCQVVLARQVGRQRVVGDIAVGNRCDDRVRRQSDGSGIGKGIIRRRDLKKQIDAADPARAPGARSRTRGGRGELARARGIDHGPERHLVPIRAEAGLDIDSLLAALPPASAAKESPAGHYVIEVHGHVDPMLLAAVTAWCAQRDVLATSLSTESRTLEAVFLELTGKDLRP